MDPATLSLAATAISVGVGAIGAMSTASANQQAAEYQAQVARNNQVVADQNARYAVDAGQARAQANDMKTRALVGEIESAQGASGIDVGSPTSQRVRASAEQVGRLDTSTIIQNAMLQARSDQAQASNFGAEAQLADMRASSAGTAGTIGAFTSLLSGASSFADKWMRFQNVGVPGFGSVY